MNLDFQLPAIESFRLLVDDYSFREVVIEPAIIRWESGSVFVRCNFDVGRSYEVMVELGQVTKEPERPFNFGEFLRSQNVPDCDWPSGYSALSQYALDELLKTLSRLLSKHGQALLRNDKEAWRKLIDLRERECREFALQRELRYARKDAVVAWDQKDYARFAAQLTPFREHLEESELAKLKYALLRIESTVDEKPTP